MKKNFFKITLTLGVFITTVFSANSTERGNMSCISQDDDYTYYECSGSGDLCDIGTKKYKRQPPVIGN